MHYLAVCVKRTILRELENTGTFIRIPVHVQGKIRKYKQARQELTNELFRPPLIHEIANRIQSSIYEVVKMERVVNLQCTVSLDEPFCYDGGSVIADYISDVCTESADSKTERKELQRLLWQAAKNCLDDDLFRLIYEYFHEEITLAAMADRNGTPVDNFKNNMLKALRRLRNDRCIRQLGTDYDYVCRFRYVPVEEFKTTWTSSVEYEVLKREEYRERLLYGSNFQTVEYETFPMIQDSVSSASKGGNDFNYGVQ